MVRFEAKPACHVIAEGERRGATSEVMFAGVELALIPARRRDDDHPSSGPRSLHSSSETERKKSLPGTTTRKSGKVPPLGEFTIRLDGRELDHIPEDVLSRHKCHTLSARRNRIASVPTSIDSLRQLTRLFLSGNRLATLPPEIARLRCLRELYVDDNSLDAVPVKLARLAGTLEILNLEGNPLTGRLKSGGDAAKTFGDVWRERGGEEVVTSSRSSGDDLDDGGGAASSSLSSSSGEKGSRPTAAAAISTKRTTKPALSKAVLLVKTEALMTYLAAHADAEESAAVAEGLRKRRMRTASLALEAAVDAVDASGISRAVDDLRADNASDRHVSMGEAAAKAAVALDQAEVARDVVRLDRALRLWAAVTGRGGAALYRTTGVVVDIDTFVTADTDDVDATPSSSSSSRLPNIAEHVGRRTASAPDGQRLSRDRVSDGGGGDAARIDQRRRRRHAGREQPRSSSSSSTDLLPLDALQAGIVMGSGRDDRLVRLYVLAKELRAAESREQWERRVAAASASSAGRQTSRYGSSSRTSSSSPWVGVEGGGDGTPLYASSLCSSSSGMIQDGDGTSGGGAAGFGASARRATAMSSFATIHVDVGAAEAIREYRVGSGSARVRSLIRSENAKTHSQWSANKKAAERARLAGFDTWRAEQRKIEEDKTRQLTAMEKRRESMKGGWVGLGHKTFPKEDKKQTLKQNNEDTRATQGPTKNRDENISGGGGRDGCGGDDLEQEEYKKKNREARPPAAQRSLSARSVQNMNRRLDKILLECVYGGGGGGGGNQQAGSRRVKKKSADAAGEQQHKTRESGLRENTNRHDRVRLPSVS